jgi:phospholipase C
MAKYGLSLVAVFLSLLLFTGCQAAKGGSNNETPPPTTTFSVGVQVSGDGTGTITSNPAGISCPTTCTASFDSGTVVTFTAQAASGSGFSSWGGSCSGSTPTCKVTMNGNTTVNATFKKGKVGSITAVNHILFMMQENRSFDHYFGHLPDYWNANGFPARQFDAEPADASNPSVDGTTTVSAYHLLTQCVENPSPSWDESHVDFNRTSPTSTNATLDGFVRTAGLDAIGFMFHDVSGARAMGYYTGDDLAYYYFMASSFATSDRWFAPIMTRTQPNRMYLIAGTSAGHAYPIPIGGAQLPNKTIFQLLDEHGISWKIYVTDFINGSPSTYLNMFTYYSKGLKNIFPMSQYMTDVAKGTLPQVAMLESGYSSGRDEHPSDDANIPNGNVQVGSRYVASIINALMDSPSWKDSVFILTWDEFGGFYDHVAPQPSVSPDNVPPQDLQPNDICSQNHTSPICDFKYTGFRVPMTVVSPFTKKNYVSHGPSDPTQPATDYTAILKFIETRFGLPSLTARDAAQTDMTEFFDFTAVPWATPPPASKRQQPVDKPCYLDHLP